VRAAALPRRRYRMKERTLKGFGERLKQIRLGRGLTQQELGDAVGVSNRVIAYYESEGAQPPGALLVELAQVLEVSADELLGIGPLREKVSAKQARIRKRLQRVEQLPPADQRAVLKLVDALVISRQVEDDG
jgi:transcriptional regulator with XRE-family HTH domain